MTKLKSLIKKFTKGGDIMLRLIIGWLIRASLDDFKVERLVITKIKERGESVLQND